MSRLALIVSLNLPVAYATFNDDALSLLSFLKPTKSACVAGALNRTLRPIEYLKTGSLVGENRGFNARFQTLLADGCFRDVARKFWADIDQDTRSNDSDLRRPGLDERAGKGRFGRFAPGWLWARAMDATNRDPHLAMQVVGLCMHDDLARKYEETLEGERATQYWDARISVEKEAIDRLDQRLNGDGTRLNLDEMIRLKDARSSHARALATAVRGKATRLPATIPFDVCPSAYSPIFALRSLDESLDLPDDLKMKIAALQRPGERHPHINAKSYHFVAGALVGCEMAECGVTPDEAGAIASTLSTYYRRQILGTKVLNFIDERAQIEAATKTPHTSAEFTDAATRYLKLHPLNRMLPKRSIEARLREMDAAQLYKDWYLGARFRLATGIRTSGPADLNQPEKERHVSEGSNLCGYPAWTIERCRLARLTLSTWDVDESWTKTQHNIGAKFGVDTCKGSVQMKDGLSKLCEKPIPTGTSGAAR